MTTPDPIQEHCYSRVTAIIFTTKFTSTEIIWMWFISTSVCLVPKLCRSPGDVAIPVTRNF
ncbi:uncharacterized protein PHALS_14493, partial [Plasmopara halstedii]